MVANKYGWSRVTGECQLITPWYNIMNSKLLPKSWSCLQNVITGLYTSFEPWYCHSIMWHDTIWKEIAFLSCRGRFIWSDQFIGFIVWVINELLIKLLSSFQPSTRSGVYLQCHVMYTAGPLQHTWCTCSIDCSYTADTRQTAVYTVPTLYNYICIL